MNSVNHIEKGLDLKRRALLTQATTAVGGIAFAGVSVPFIASLAPSERARAFGAPVAVDVNALARADRRRRPHGNLT
jgi:ubiquinol-cytochrome c reductase iron-sulfur subunit